MAGRNTNARRGNRSDSKRRPRGGARSRGPRWVPVESSVDRNNEETFGSIESSEWTEEWSQQKALEFEQFKRQRLLQTHKESVSAEQEDKPIDVPAVIDASLGSTNQDFLQQILEATDLFGWNTEAGNSPDGRWATTATTHSPSSPVMASNKLPASNVPKLPPLTKRHVQAMHKTPGHPVPWPSPMLNTPESKTPWMSQAEMGAVLNLQLLHMEKANQILSRPQTVRLDADVVVVPDVGEALPLDFRRSLLCECSRLLRDDPHFNPLGSLCPLIGTEMCLSEGSYLSDMYAAEEGLKALIQFQISPSEQALNAAIEVCLDSALPPASIDRSCRRLMVLYEHAKGLRLVAQVYTHLITSPLGQDIGSIVWLVAAHLRNFRILSATCRAVSRDFAFFVPILRHAIDHRSVISVSGPDSLAAMVREITWEQLHVPLMGTGVDSSDEGQHLKRTWLCIVHTLARLVQEQRFGIAPHLLRNLVLGYLQSLCPHPLNPTQIIASMYVPTNEAVQALSEPALSLILVLLLLLIQDHPDGPNAPTYYSTCEGVQHLLNTLPLELVGYNLDDTAVTFVGVGMILRAAVARSVQVPHLLDPSSVFPHELEVLNILPSLNVIFQTIRLALNSDAFSSLLKAAFAASGCVVENCLISLHEQFPP